MKRLLIILSLVLAGLAVTGQDSRQTYIDKYSDIAVSEMYRTGVPASITLAQGIIESGAGLSKLAVEGNNHFGIKCHTDWKGRTMAVDDDKKGECFRVYKNAEQSFRDHSDFLRYRDRYKFLFSYDVTDYKSWAYGLKKAGYATDPAYSGKLIKMIEDYKLWRYDTPKVEERPDTIPESPEVIEEPKRIDTDVYDEDFVFPLKRPVYEKNGVPFVYASEGDSYASIAQSYKLFRREILRYNDLDESEPLAPGTMVYIQPKKAYAAKGLDKYIVGEDPVTLRDICQRFAVRLRSVRRLNGFAADYVPSEGDTVLLRPAKRSGKK